MADRRFIDVSHTIEDGLITYKGLPAPIICDYISREASRAHYGAGTEFHIGKIEMVANTGTYIDAPFHRYVEGKDLSELPLSSIAGLDGVVVRVDLSRGKAVGEAAFRGRDVAGKAVLVHTGWSKHWRTDPYFEDHPFLTEGAALLLRNAGAALLLRNAGAALVGIDSLNIDDTTDGRRPVHTLLLGHDIPVVEHLTNLDHLPDKGFRFFAVPVKVKALGSFPVRAFGVLE